MYILNILSAIKNITIKELKDFKLIIKIHDAFNAKKYYQSFLKNKSKKLVKRLKLVTRQPKTLETSNITNIKSVFLELPKTSLKLSKTIR